jgi:hypothetical protein
LCQAKSDTFSLTLTLKDKENGVRRQNDPPFYPSNTLFLGW